MGNSASLEQRVRALIVSPAYKGTYNYLECTIEDGKLWYDMLATKAKLPPQCIRWISDWRKYPQVNGPSNMKDIGRELNDLVEWANRTTKPIIFIAYSGHGTNQPDDNGDEEDGMDEGWVSSDLGFVRDDYLNQQLARLPKDALVIAFNDACYNGTVWDTPFTAMYIGKDKPEIKQRARAKMGQIAPVIDDEVKQQIVQAANQSAVALKADQQTIDSIAQDRRKLVWLAVLAIAAAIVYNAKQLTQTQSQTLLKLIALVASFVAMRPMTSSRSSRVPVKRAVIQEDAMDPEKAVAKYSSGVFHHLNAGQQSKPKRIECTFTGFSSSNDKQVSYEGAKNGFFTYFVHAILKEELYPILEKASSVEEVLSSWKRTGYSLINETGSKLSRIGMRQNPIWQVNADVKVTEDTSIFLQ